MSVALFLLAAAWPCERVGAQTSYSVVSPNRRIAVTVRAAGRVAYDVTLDGKPLLKDSTLALDVDGTVLGLAPEVRDAEQRAVNGFILPSVRVKSERVKDNYNELRVEFEGGYAVVFRAYDEGAAYRFETRLARSEVKIRGEHALFNFAGDARVYYPKEEGFMSHNERLFLPIAMKSLSASDLASIPAVVETTGGVKVVVAESDVEDYPGMWLRGTGGDRLEAAFPPYPLKEEPVEGRNRDRDIKVTQTADYIASTKGARTFPWRLFAVAERDADLITNQLVYLLAAPSRIEDTSWIRPGKVAWDWWNANNVHGVDFKSGVNTETYKYYIDFASRHGIEYVVLDEGWYKLGNVLEVSPAMDMDELAAYARRKNVGLILWVVWKTFDEQMEPAFAQFEKWGVKGIKVDFMQRDDRPLMNFYHKVCREAAKRRILVDFHGAIRSVLLARTWPNLVSNEGVRGLEWNKWSATADPEHNVTLPFTRMLLGPMDYTPGATVNAAKNSHAAVFERPMSMGTRAHQLAMYVVYESPLQMLADSPSNYLREPETLEFLSAVPTVWDETRVLDARLGDYVLLARRRGRDWYVGAMTDWTPRELELDLSFLPAGNFRLDAYRDGVNADRFGSDYRRERSRVNASSRLKLRLAPGGGWAARITPEKN